MDALVQKKRQLLLQKISYYIILVSLILVFLSSGIVKLTNNETIVANFAKWQLLEWKNVIAILEITSAVLLLFNRTKLTAVILLTILMGGALFTHIKHDEPFFFPAALIAVLWISQLLIQPKNTSGEK